MKYFILTITFLLTGCNTAWNPFSRTDTVNNYKTRQDISEIRLVNADAENVIDNLQKESKDFTSVVEDDFETVIACPETTIVGTRLKRNTDLYMIAVEDSLLTLERMANHQSIIIGDIHDRSKPSYGIKWYWWLIIGISGIGILGGAPALFALFKFMKKTTGMLAGLADGMVESMEVDDKIDNKRIPKTLKDK